MSIHNVCFYGEVTKIIPKLSSNTLLIRSTAKAFVSTDDVQTSIHNTVKQADEKNPLQNCLSTIQSQDWKILKTVNHLTFLNVQ